MRVKVISILGESGFNQRFFIEHPSIVTVITSEILITGTNFQTLVIFASRKRAGRIIRNTFLTWISYRSTTGTLLVIRVVTLVTTNTEYLSGKRPFFISSAVFNLIGIINQIFYSTLGFGVVFPSVENS